VKLPQARVVYGTYGSLNDAKDNVVLLETVPCSDGIVWEWELVLPEQHAGAVSRAALSGDDHSRQRGGGAPSAD
jgi:hypothetical protein